MQITLQWYEPETGQSIEITAGLPIWFGRGADNTVVLVGEKVSRRHAVIRQQDDEAVLFDNRSTNGTFLNGERIERHTLRSGDTIEIGAFHIMVRIPDAAESSQDAAEPAPELAPTVAESGSFMLPTALKGTLVFSEESADLLPYLPADQPGDAPAEAPFPPAIFAEKQVSLEALRAAGYDVDETTYLALGGGLGSFIWVNHLAVFGVKPTEIVSLGLEPSPYARYARLCRNSQIPDHERLRSNSDSCPDNLWGWPGYAVREMWESLRRGQLGSFIKVGWSIFAEPALAQTYTPRAGDVFRSIDREAHRIGWGRIWRYGRLKAIRKADDGRFVVAYSQSTPERGRINKLFIGRFLHLAMGYPGVRFLPDLQAYREQERDFKGVVNAYEEHEHVYADLRANGGTVLIRGRGIVASRIIQRLHELRREGAGVQILHLMRTPISSGNRYRRARRVTKNHWEFQPFNWPKACWGGELRNVLQAADAPGREALLEDWGGTTTAARRDWRQIIDQGLSEGWYQIRFGDVQKVVRNEEGRLATIIQARGAIAEQTSLMAHYIVDCTGLEADLSASPLLQDLVTHYGLRLNPKGRLDVADDFEVRGMANQAGRLYASGAMTLGGPYAPVDSFLGLQYTAQRSVDSLVRLGAPGLVGLNGLRSFAQWWRWARGVSP